MGKHLVRVGGGHAHMTVMLNLHEHTDRSPSEGFDTQIWQAS